ncbi:sigma factor [Nonomuraea jiangxiensis]|uniref:RNA polymerase sigma-70 factor, ECF subfamily n=1 Tax=Nonomuraea jiangxiensis TaxID=633440 RepID=A0A1G9BCD0_9ACTN|nr:sigma factor [Nonomuraea jiangxiensis]SDK36515.1 RNA polymerase sigma-70 factor, ECF subfamily [Nonomuraea jiangxiensis]
MSEHRWPASRPDAGISAIVGERRLLGEVALRLLGSAHEAEDVVRETYARWYAMPEALQHEIDSPTAWLVSVANRLCHDWLNGPRANPNPSVTRGPSITTGPPVATGRRRPAEAAPHRTPAGSGPGTPAAGHAHRHDHITRAFKEACERDGGVGALTALFAPDVAVIADGGGRVRAPLHPIIGAERAARFVLGLFGGQTDVTIVERPVNGGPGLVVHVAGTTAAVVSLHIGDDRVQHVWIVMNPDKLAPWRADPPADTIRTG